MTWFFEMYRNYANFSGRASRPAYWWAFLFVNLTFFGLGLVDVFAGTELGKTGLGLFNGLFMLMSIIPMLALAVRRLHDTNLSGWWVLVNAIPLGFLVGLFLMVRPSSPAPNKYGALILH